MAAEELLEANKKINLKNLQEIVGGSMSTVNDYWQEIKKNPRYMKDPTKKTEITIVEPEDRLKIMYNASIAAKTEQATSELIAANEELQSDNSTLALDLKAKEEEINILKAQRDAALAKMNEAEGARSIVKFDNEALTKQVSELTAKLAAAEAKCQLTEAAIAEAKIWQEDLANKVRANIEEECRALKDALLSKNTSKAPDKALGTKKKSPEHTEGDKGKPSNPK